MSGTSTAIVGVIDTLSVKYNNPTRVFDTIAPNGCIAKAIRVSITATENQAIIDFTSIMQSGAIDQIQSMYWENCFASEGQNISQVLQTSSLQQAMPLNVNTWGYMPLALTNPDSVTLINEGGGDTEWQINLIFFNVHLEPATFLNAPLAVSLEAGATVPVEIEAGPGTSSNSPLFVQSTPPALTGTTTHALTTAIIGNENAAHSVEGEKLSHINVYNPNAAVSYLQIFINSNALPTYASAPDYVISIPAGQTVDADFASGLLKANNGNGFVYYQASTTFGTGGAAPADALAVSSLFD
jgi:hypothetical protein